MSSIVNAVYEGGGLRLLAPLPLPDQTPVRVRIETVAPDGERSEWLAQGQRTLSQMWDNDEDDVYNALLAQ